MSIPIGAIIVVILLLVLLFWVLRQVDIPQPIKTVILVIVVVLAVIWLIQAFGVGSWRLDVGG